MASFIYFALALFVISTNLNVVRPEVKWIGKKNVFCAKEGLNTHPYDCTKFFICTRGTDDELEGAMYKCSEGEAFHDQHNTCVPTDEVPSCTSTLRGNLRRSKRCTDSEEETGNCNHSLESCTEPIFCNGCDKISVCVQGKVATTISCGNDSYCDPNTVSCTNQVPPDCSSGFKCTDKGYFPDPSDCAKYQICVEKGDSLAAAEQYCAANQVYSSSKKMCVPKLRLSDCHQVSCPAKNTVITAFPGEKSYYVICVNGSPDYVFFCGIGKEYNPSKNTCEVVCHETGRLPDVDCTKYFECTPNRLNTAFTMTSHECPSGTYYVHASQACESGTCNK